jgi:hypothetical protein
VQDLGEQLRAMRGDEVTQLALERLGFPRQRSGGVAAYDVAMRTLDEIAELYVERSMSQDDATKLKELGDQLGDQMTRFAKLARSRVGPREIKPTSGQQRRWRLQA